MFIFISFRLTQPGQLYCISFYLVLNITLELKQNFILKIEETEHSMNRCYHPGNQNIDAD